MLARLVSFVVLVLGVTNIGSAQHAAPASHVSNVNYSELVERVNELERLVSQPGVLEDDSFVYSDYGDYGWYALYENVIVQPHFTRDPAYYIVDGLAGVTESAQEIPFDWNLSYSPRAEIGYAGPTHGFRVRYWHFDQNTTIVQAAGPNVVTGFGGSDGIGVEIDDNDGLTASHALQMDVLDSELTFPLQSLLCSAGIRVARSDQGYRAVDPNEGIVGRHDFRGVGPTLSVEGNVPATSCLSLFAKMRGSLLYGKSSSFAASFNPMNPLVFDDAVIRRNNNGDVVSVGEIQLGADVRRELNGGQVLFLTAALEAQYWSSLGTGLDGQVDADDDSNYQNESAQNADVGFFGFVLGLGILH